MTDVTDTLLRCGFCIAGVLITELLRRLMRIVRCQKAIAIQSPGPPASSLVLCMCPAGRVAACLRPMQHADACCRIADSEHNFTVQLQGVVTTCKSGMPGQ